MINPTINMQPGNISKIPIVISDDTSLVDGIVRDNIIHTKYDWDCYESSWDFEKHPLT